MPSYNIDFLNGNLISIIENNGKCSHINSNRSLSDDNTDSGCVCHMREWCIKNTDELPPRGEEDIRLKKAALLKALELNLIPAEKIFDEEL